MKFLKRLVITLAILAAIFFFVGLPYMQEQTKKHSPEQTVTHEFKGGTLTVNYSSPSKKDRVIFGELVPYGNVWRTGANEPTTFSTTKEINIIDKALPAGTYSLWTIPNKDSWKVIFNKEVADWGVTLLSGGSKTTRKPEADIIVVEVPSKEQVNPIENFTIAFEEKDQLYMDLLWDHVKVQVPIH